MNTVTTFLWFDSEAEAAATFYTSLFDDGLVNHVDYFGSAGPRPAGMVKTVSFELAGHRLMALNGGDSDTFNEAVSLMIRCDTQAEVDRLWDQLTAGGGTPGPCGWLKDRYGLSWQVVPELMFSLVGDADETKAQAVMAAMLQMGKIDSSQLQAAYDNARGAA
jgi:predicted 3-demethylubiquinone-9 3-methyltransferase (glyoxalase superfamily)